MLNWLMQNYGLVLLALYSLDKVIEATPLKSDSTFQLISAAISGLYNKTTQPK
jgi:hypothetical protein